MDREPYFDKISADTVASALKTGIQSRLSSAPGSNSGIQYTSSCISFSSLFRGSFSLFHDDDKQNPNFAIPSYYLRELLSKVEVSN